ncbi:MAG: spore coat protein CotJB [Clostridia bacterium]|nr:spore coat protein CotJB [Clostridia bacterium]
MTKYEMMKKIQEYNFSVIELVLYLDTHPTDLKALNLHKEYTKSLKELKDKYQKVYGPLTIYYPCNKWRWIEEPWPWEGSDM